MRKLILKLACSLLGQLAEDADPIRQKVFELVCQLLTMLLEDED